MDRSSPIAIATSITELCEMHGVARKTGYKWIDRYLRHGPAGLEERSRRPRRSPDQTADEIRHGAPRTPIHSHTTIPPPKHNRNNSGPFMVEAATILGLGV